MEFSTQRAQRVINAFIGCVKTGVYSLDYATTLIEDQNKYGYLTDSDKEMFYNTFSQNSNEVKEGEI